MTQMLAATSALLVLGYIGWIILAVIRFRRVNDLSRADCHAAEGSSSFRGTPATGSTKLADNNGDYQ